jgi:diacylglycerol kinase family enzyme
MRLENPKNDGTTRLDVPGPSTLQWRRLMTLEVILFTSPKAGSGASREQIPRLVDLLDASDLNNQLVSCPKELRKISRERRETGVPQPVVIAAGGDGTISLVASNTRAETPLLPMPMGTENLLARYIGQKNDAESVMKTLQGGRAMQLDAGLANGRLFLIMATAGFDAEVVRRLHLKRQGHIRRTSYLKPILQTLLHYRFPKLHVTAFDHQDQVVDQRDVGWAMTFNLPCYGGGLNIHPDAIGDDGKLDLITFAGAGVFSGIRYVLGIMWGNHRRLQDVDQNRVSRIRIEADRRVAFELDGDYAGRLPLEIKTLPGRVRVMVPDPLSADNPKI